MGSTCSCRTTTHLSRSLVRERLGTPPLCSAKLLRSGPIHPHGTEPHEARYSSAIRGASRAPCARVTLNRFRSCEAVRSGTLAQRHLFLRRFGRGTVLLAPSASSLRILPGHRTA